MVFGHINELEQLRPLIPQVGEILAFYSKRDVLQVGEWMQLAKKLKVIRLSDYNRNNLLLEAHHRNYDLHITIKGADRMMACLATEPLEVVKEYDIEKDFILYSGKEDGEFHLREGMWVLLFPNEAHRNEFLAEETEKLVFKIEIE